MKKPQIYIIQTNTSLDNHNNPQDFQSMIYSYSESWEEFKTYLLSNDDFTEKLVNGTMLGTTKPKNAKIIETLINDDNHVEIIMENHRGFRFNAKYYLVNKEVFEQFINSLERLINYF